MIISLDENAPIPAYDQLREQITDAIIGGGLRPGERLAPIRQLANDLEVSPGTVARAYRELEASQLIKTRGRHGSFVLEVPEAQLNRQAKIAAIIETCAQRLQRYGLSLSEASALLQQRMG